MIRKAAMLLFIVTIVFAVSSCSEDSTKPKDQDPPEVSITNSWDAAKEGGVKRQGIVDITAEAYDPAGVKQVELYVNNSRVSVDRTSPYAFEWDMTSLQENSINTVYLRAVDGNGNAKTTESITVTKSPSSKPVATLTSPSDGAIISQGDKLALSGSATDEEDGTLSDSQITWSSDIQGMLGQGTTLNHRGLILGDHVITMTASDSDGLKDTRTIKLTVNENSLPYAVVEKGTYYLGEPLFRRQTVRLTKGFYVYKTEISVAEFMELFAEAEGGGEADYKALRKWSSKRNRGLYDDGEGLYVPLFEDGGSGNDALTDVTYADYPACFITYVEAAVACNIMSDRDGLDRAYIYLDKNDEPTDDYGRSMRGMMVDENANGWRLPTEAEYEIAARAGLTTAKFPWGNTGPGALCNSMSDPSPPNPINLYNGRGPCPVKSYRPNRYGLYNIVGNVAEMTSDMFVGVPPSGVDPLVVLEDRDPKYLVKGGAWYEFGGNMQIAMRHIQIPFSDKDKDSIGSGIGFRPVRRIDNDE